MVEGSGDGTCITVGEGVNGSIVGGDERSSSYSVGSALGRFVGCGAGTKLGRIVGKGLGGLDSLRVV